MYDIERSKHYTCIGDNFFNCQQPRQLIHLKEKKHTVLFQKYLLWEKIFSLIENLRIKPLSCFKYQIKITLRSVLVFFR